MGNWTVTVPEARTNYMVNPCAAFNTTGFSSIATDGTYNFSRDTTQSVPKLGIFTCFKLETLTGTFWRLRDAMPGTNTGNETLSLLVRRSDNAAITSSNVQLIVNGQFLNADVYRAVSGGWYYAYKATTGTSNTFQGIAIISSGTYYITTLSCEIGSYPTTYIDGDQPGCYWNGIAHGSTSSRDAQYRGGGREVDLETTYGVKVLSPSGFGMPPLQNNLQPMSLQPGALFQSYKILPRTLTLITNTLTDINSTQALFHQRRDNLINLLAPDVYRGSQPIVIGYTGASSTRTVYGQYRVNSGFEGTALTSKNESIAVQLIAVDPLLYEQTQEIATLTFTQTLANDFAFGRIKGAWQRFGTGPNSAVNHIVIDYQNNRVYFGGTFTTANGVTVNCICYWDGTTFQPLGAATKGVSGGVVNSIAIAPNGDIWAGGTFTAAGGSATKGLAKWAYPGTGAPSVYNTATTFTAINAIVIDKNYKIYIGGTFTVFMGTANASYIAASANQGSTWTALTATVATGGTPKVSSIAVDIDGVGIYFGGDFTAIGGVANTARIAKYNGTSTITALGSGISGEGRALLVVPNGTLYIANGAELDKWDGVSLTILSTVYGCSPNGLSYDPNTNLLYVGLPGVVDGFQFVAYNGATFINPDFSLSILDYVCIAVHRITSDIFVGIRTTYNPPTGTITTVTPSSSSQTYPMITITGTTTAGASSTLRWLENQSTAQRVYFNLNILAGETITIDLRPGIKSVTSNWRGRIYDNPLSNSDFANFYLLPGPNTIAVFMNGTTTGCNMIMSWQPVHWGVDGVSQ